MSSRPTLPSRPAALLLAGLALAGCDDGEISIRLTDAPADDMAAVVLAVRAVEIERNDGEIEQFDFEPAREIDFAELRDGRSLELMRATVEPGDFRQLRLRFQTTDGPQSPRAVTHGGAVFAIEFLEARASAALSFSVDEGQHQAITLDLDLRRSLLRDDNDLALGRLRLQPHMRAVLDRDAGQLRGSIHSSLLQQAGCTPGVYLYQGHDVTPTRLSARPGPYATTQVNAVLDGAAYAFAMLPAGPYTLAYTCDALADDPEHSRQPVDFPVRGNLRIEAGRSHEVNINP